MTEDQTAHPQPTEKQPRKSVFETIKYHVDNAIVPYQKVLHSEYGDIENDDLSELARKQLDTHVAQLDQLAQILTEVSKGKSFTPVVQMHKLLDRGDDSSRETYTLRLARTGEKVPIGSENPQVQLGFHANIAAGGEHAIEALYALGRSGKDPQTVLEMFFRQSSGQSVTVNTVGVHIDPATESFRVTPQAGITFRWNRGEPRARVGGVVYIGTQPHFAELLPTVPLSDFAYMQSAIVGIAAPKGKSSRK